MHDHRPRPPSSKTGSSARSRQEEVKKLYKIKGKKRKKKAGKGHACFTGRRAGQTAKRQQRPNPYPVSARPPTRRQSESVHPPDQIQKGQRMMAVLTAEAEGQEQEQGRGTNFRRRALLLAYLVIKGASITSHKAS